VLETRRAGALLILRMRQTLDSVPSAGAARKGNPARAHSRKGMVAPLASSGTQHLPSLKKWAGATEESVSGFGQHTRKVRSYRAVCLHFVSCCRSRTTTSCPEKGELVIPNRNLPHRRKSSIERGLAQSGRPRRAKWRRKANRGGKIARSSSRRTGITRKGGVAGLPASDRWKVPRVVIAVLSSRGGRGKRSRPSQSPSSRERGEPTGEATGASEVSRSKSFEVTHRVGEKIFCRERERNTEALGAS
jgi:hypothetical protein